MTNHDKKEIEKLKEFREWLLWFRALSKEEQEKWIMKRWKNETELRQSLSKKSLT